MSFKRLMKMVEEKNSAVVVGIDPTIERFPEYILEKYQSNYDKLLAFGKEVIDGVYDIVPAVKLQVAYFESYGIDGMRAFSDLMKYAKEKELYVVADVKRGDIGSTSTAYAKAYFESGGDFEADAITINPYLGDDNNNAFYELASKNDKGIFVLVKTSNKTSGQFQDLKFEGKPLYEHVANKIEENDYNNSEDEFSNIGAVVGATYPAQISEIRRMLSNNVFLIPGYGAQGGTAESIKDAFDANGLGAIVNSSRGIIYAYEQYKLTVGQSARLATIKMNEDLNQWRKK